MWAADCAERALPLSEVIAPTDPRPREAIRGLRAFAGGTARIALLRALSARAHAAARDVNTPSAIAAARAAGQAAAVAHMAGHALGVAYATIAAGLAEPDDPDATRRETDWQISHASPVVRDIPCRLPPRASAGTGLRALIGDMDRRIREDATS